MRAQQLAELDAAAHAGVTNYWRQFQPDATRVPASGTVWDYRLAIATAPCQCNGTGTVTPDVPHNHPAYQAFPCSCVIRERAKRLYLLFDAAGIPPRFARLSFETFEALPAAARAEKAGMIALARKFADVSAYVEHGGVYVRPASDQAEERRPGLLLFGPCGTGKSAVSAIIAKAWQDAGMSVLWITALEFIKSIQNTYGTDDSGLKTRRLQAARDVDLLVLDDLGREREGQRQQSEDRLDILDLVIAHRHAYEKTTILTSNLTPTQMEAQFDKRLVNRIVYELCHVVRAGGLDLRPPAKG